MGVMEAEKSRIIHSFSTELPQGPIIQLGKAGEDENLRSEKGRGNGLNCVPLKRIGGIPNPQHHRM